MGYVAVDSYTDENSGLWTANRASGQRCLPPETGHSDAWAVETSHMHQSHYDAALLHTSEKCSEYLSQGCRIL